jgi:hypothetical protein
MTSNVTAGRPGGGGLALAGAGGGGPVVQLQFANTSGDLFMTWLKNSVRAAGGDPAMFTRKVAFA